MPTPAPAAAPLTDSEIERLQALLAGLPPPLQPLDVSALDGYLCGVLLQPQRVPAERWLPWLSDVEGRPAPASPALDELRALALRRHAELDAAIARRDWFDPWVFEVEEEDGEEPQPDPAQAHAAGDGDADGAVSPATPGVLPWVAGFAAAMDAHPALMALEDPALVEPLALLYLHFDAADLEDADALLAVIETIEPPADLAEAVQDVVRAVMLLADVTRPRAARRKPPQQRQRRR